MFVRPYPSPKINFVKTEITNTKNSVESKLYQNTKSISNSSSELKNTQPDSRKIPTFKYSESYSKLLRMLSSVNEHKKTIPAPRLSLDNEITSSLISVNKKPVPTPRQLLSEIPSSVPAILD